MSQPHRYARGNHFLACAHIGFIRMPMVIPGHTCNGCAHYARAISTPEWVMSKNCPCLDCLSKRVLLLEDNNGELYTLSDRLEHWTDGPIPDFAADEWFNPSRLNGLENHGNDPEANDISGNGRRT